MEAETALNGGENLKKKKEKRRPERLIIKKMLGKYVGTDVKYIGSREQIIKRYRISLIII